MRGHLDPTPAAGYLCKESVRKSLVPARKLGLVRLPPAPWFISGGVLTSRMSGQRWIQSLLRALDA